MSKKNEKKYDAKKLAEELLIPRRSGLGKTTEKVLAKAESFGEGYKKFLDRSKTEREAVKTAVALAEKEGFVPFDAAKTYKAGDKVYCNNRGKALILAVIGKNGCRNGVRIAAAHIDSPRLDLKPHPLYEQNELAMFKSHYYGGIKKYQWTAIPLSMHGFLVKKDGSTVEINVGEEAGDPQFCVTDLLPHLSAEQMTKTLAKAIEGENLNILIGSQPLDCDEGDNLVKLNVMRLLNEKYGITEEDFVSADIEFVPAFKAADVGFDRSMIGAYGHDDRVCAYPALTAVLEGAGGHTALAILADKEEIGSEGNTGMQSKVYEDLMEEICLALGANFRKVRFASKCLSADVTAAYDPNFAGVFERMNAAMLSCGACMSKFTGARGKSGSNDANAEFVGEVRRMFAEAGVVWQTAELGKVDAGGGGTVAKFLANLNIDTAFVAASGFDENAGFSVGSQLDALLKRAVIAKARRVVIIMDSSKAGAMLPFTFAGINDIDMLVTDDGFPEELRERLQGMVTVV